MTRLGGFASHPQHRTHTHSELASNASDPGPRSTRRRDGRHLVRVAILQPPAPVGATSGYESNNDMPAHAQLTTWTTNFRYSPM